MKVLNKRGSQLASSDKYAVHAPKREYTSISLSHHTYAYTHTVSNYVHMVIRQRLIVNKIRIYSVLINSTQPNQPFNRRRARTHTPTTYIIFHAITCERERALLR